MGWCRACTVAMLCQAAPATLSPTRSSGRRIWFETVHNCSVHNAAPFPVHLDLDGTPARRYLPVLPWWRRQLMGPLRRIAVPCVVSSRTPRRGLGREAHRRQTTKRFPVCDHASMWRYYPPVPPLEPSRLGPCGAMAGYPPHPGRIAMRAETENRGHDETSRI